MTPRRLGRRKKGETGRVTERYIEGERERRRRRRRKEGRKERKDIF